MEVLAHINTRVTLQTHIGLNTEDLIALIQDPNVSSPTVKRFGLIYLKLAVMRSDKKVEIQYV